MADTKQGNGGRGETHPERAAHSDLFGHLFDWPFRRPMVFFSPMDEDALHVEEFTENGNLVIRADMPGIDPEKDVEISVSDGMVTIAVERRQEETTEEKTYVRRELRYGSFRRTLALPTGASESDVTASYKDGILEVVVPVAKPAPATKIPVTTTS